jgi:phosphate acyltransferase
MRNTMKIAIDAMGGDHAPEAIVQGVMQAEARLNTEDTSLVLVGPRDRIAQLLQRAGYEGSRIEIVDATDVIEMGEHPTKALSQKPNSSISVGFKLLKSGQVDAFCSAGNTGAMMVGALFSIRAVEGVHRPAIAGFAPQMNGSYAVILDIGANADCKPEMLDQFAVLGTLYAQATLGMEAPRVALMNIGEEEQKGSLVAQAAYQLMKENKRLNFVGNIEGKDFFHNKAEVIVTDGFTGNILLKMGESLYKIMKDRQIEDDFLERTNYESVGGSPIIGVNGNVIIAHGRSSAKAIENMVFLAKKQAESAVYKIIQETFA